MIENKDDDSKIGLAKTEVTLQFEKLFEDKDNENCLHCGKKSRQWAEIKHGIFLCLSCAAEFKENGNVVNIKSISLDIWNREELNTLRAGGNRKFKQFLNKYGFETTQPKEILRTKAVEYYRQCIHARVTNTQIPQQPSIEQGQKPWVQQIPIMEMDSEQLLKQAKEKIQWIGTQSKIYGKKAYDKVQYKVTSGQLKEDAIKAGEKVSQTAKSIWAFVTSKIDQLKTEETNKTNRKKEEEILL